MSAGLSAAAIGAIGVGVSAAGAIASGVMQSNGMSNAKGINASQYGQSQQAIKAANAAAQSDLQPYNDIGTGANNQLAWEMGTGGAPAGFTGTGQQGALTQPYGMSQYQNDPLYTPMVNSLQDLQATPGYQFQLQQGLQSVNNSAAANGSLLSGQQVKAVNDYAQGQASTGYQAAWNRAQQAYQQAFANNNTNNNNTFSRLQTMGANGQSAAGGQAAANSAMGAQLAGLSTGYGNTQANLAQAQGNVSANIGTGISNALTGGLAQYQTGLNSANNTQNILGQQVQPSGSVANQVSWAYNPNLG